MDAPVKEIPYFKLLKLSTISQKIGMHKDKMYNCLNGKYNSFTEKDKSDIFDASFPAIKEFYNRIGKEVYSKEELEAILKTHGITISAEVPAAE